MFLNTSLQKEARPENVDLFIKTKKQMIDLLRNNFVISDPNNIGYFRFAPAEEMSNKKLGSSVTYLLLAKIEYKDTGIKKPVSIKKSLQG